jgi:hypothetical protein
MSRIIARWLKGILFRQISTKQSSFLEGRQIHEVVGVAQEASHSIKVKNLKAMVVKVDLSKAYDMVSWIYSRLTFIVLGFYPRFVYWVMNCITFISFAILRNGATTPFIMLKYCNCTEYSIYY